MGPDDVDDRRWNDFWLDNYFVPGFGGILSDLFDPSGGSGSWSELGFVWLGFGPEALRCSTPGLIRFSIAFGRLPFHSNRPCSPVTHGLTIEVSLWLKSTLSCQPPFKVLHLLNLSSCSSCVFCLYLPRDFLKSRVGSRWNREHNTLPLLKGRTSVFVQVNPGPPRAQAPPQSPR